MNRLTTAFGVALLLFLAAPARATIFGNVRGIVHDPQHRPIPDAQATLRAVQSDWSATTQTNAEGEFQFSGVAIGEYRITIEAAGFSPAEANLTVVSGSAPVLHFPMRLEAVKQSVTVTEAPGTVATETTAAATLVSRSEIERTPGADRSTSLAMITNFVPGSFMSHNMLHVRGGHMLSWWMDGAPVPNLSIATNLAPPFDPKDIDYLEVQRGGLASEYGDRTFGVINVVPRSGFERNNQAELVLNYGNFHSLDSQVSFGSHTERFAYYASLRGNRTDLGLETPAPEVIHNLGSGLGGFSSLIFNATPHDQLRLVASLRNDHFQIPNTPEDQELGLRDLDLERDAFLNFTWARTMSAGMMLTVSPFYHFNRAAYAGGAGDTPLVPDYRRASHYLGGQAALSIVRGRHNAQVGVMTMSDRDSYTFALTPAADPTLALREQQRLWGNLQTAFLEDRYKLTRWFTLMGGMRLTRFGGVVTETAASPRLGAALELPRLGWVLHASYGRFYQAPPLTTISGPILDLAFSQGLTFLPLHGERDEQHEFGLTVPARGWTVEVRNFRTAARNYFDHDVLGSSSIFLPITIERARVRGWDTTLRSPRLLNRAQVRLVWAHQYVEAQGAVSGGLTDFQPPPAGAYYFLDFDQRDTANLGFDLTLPRQTWLNGNVGYGSGALDMNGPAHLPAHTTLDLAVGRTFHERWSAHVFATNVFNRRYLIDHSNEFAGTHFAHPRQVGIELRYRFHY